MSDTSKVSVVILNWNGAKYLRQFLPSVIAHSGSAEIVVADNGSTDESLKLLSETFPSVTVYDLGANHGFSKGYNLALAAIKTPYSVLLNSDVEVSPNWLEPQIQLLESQPELAAVQPCIMDLNNRARFEYAGAAGGFIDRFGYPFCRGRIFSSLEENHGQYNDSTYIFWGSGAALMIRTELYLKCGGLDEYFFAHFEEIDLCWRMLNRGFKIRYCPQATVYHLGGGSLNYGSPKKTFLNFRNSLCMLHKNLTEGLVFRGIAARLVLDGITGAQLFLTGKFSHTWAIIKAHFAYYGQVSKLNAFRQAEKEHIKNTRHKTVYQQSIVWHYYGNKIKTFAELPDSYNLAEKNTD